MILQVESRSGLPDAVYCESTLTRAEEWLVATGSAAVFSAVSPDKLTPNEDAAAILPFDDASGVLAVADGMGGGRAGEQAAAIAIQALRLSLQEAAHTGHPLRTAILNGIDDANQLVQALGIGAATTLAVIEIQENSVRPYHVGDSMILIVGQRGKCKLQTVCHSPVGFAIEAGLLDEAEAMHHEDRHIVSNMIGTPTMRIEVGSPMPLAPRDTVLLASDGLFDNLHLPEIIDRIRKGKLTDSIGRLAGAAQRRMRNPREGEPSKPDDLTIVAYRRTPPPRRERTLTIAAEPAEESGS